MVVKWLGLCNVTKTKVFVMSYNSRQICDTQYVEVCFKGIGQVRSEFSIGYVKTDVGFWEFPHWTINPLSRDCPLEVSVRMSCWTKRVFKSVSAAHWIWCPHAILKESPGFDNLSNVGKLTKSAVNPMLRSSTWEQYSVNWGPQTGGSTGTEHLGQLSRPCFPDSWCL